MVSGFISLLAEFREESTFLPSIIFGYLYSKYSTLPVCSFGSDLLYTLTGLNAKTYFILYIFSLTTSTGIYTISKADLRSYEIRNSAPRPLARCLDIIVYADSFFTVIAIIPLLTRVCNGDLVANTLLFIQVGILATTLWFIILDRYTDLNGIRGISK